MDEKIYPEYSILIVDDEPAWLRSMEFMLDHQCGINNVITCADSRQVPDLVDRNNVGLVLLDLNMPHLAGEDILAALQKDYPQILVIVITGLTIIDRAVECMKAGAFDFFVKSWGSERLASGILRAIKILDLRYENRQVSQAMLEPDLERPEAFADIITVSPRMLTIFKYMESIAKSKLPVLITGESGTGKELIARAMHHLSGSGGELVSINMASLDDNMLEDALFGHAKGAYTNAERDRDGLAKKAASGTLFLDEIGELSLSSQAKLLRFIQEGEYYPLGSDKKNVTNARILFATNQNLAERQSLGLFRQDLYFRLTTHHVHIPPLRERREDIALLVNHYARKAAEQLGVPLPEISSELVLKLSAYDFPGNVRELISIVTNAVSLAGKELLLEHFAIVQPTLAADQARMDEESEILAMFLRMGNFPTLDSVRKIMTTAALHKTGGNQTGAAKLLGISQGAVSKRLKS